MSMNTTQVPHYGVKIAFDPIAQGLPGTSAVLGYLSMSASYHLTMKTLVKIKQHQHDISKKRT